MAAFNAGSIVGDLDLDRDPFTEGLRRARQQAEDFERQRISPTVDVDVAHVREQLERLGELFDELDGRNVSPHIDVDTQQATQQLNGVQQQVQQLGNATATPRIDLLDGDARRSLLDTRRSLRELDGIVARARVEATTLQAQADFARVQNQIRDLSELVARPGIDVRGTQRAQAQLLALEAQLERLQGRHTIEVDTDTTGGGIPNAPTNQRTTWQIDVRGQARAMLAMITGAAQAATAAVGLLALALAALAAVEGTLAVLAAGIGVLGAMATAAGAGVALFGLAAMTAFKPILANLKNLKAEQEAYNNAVTDDEKIRALGALNAGMTELTDTQRAMALGIVQIKKQWADMARAVQPEVYEAARHGIGGVLSLLPQLEPLLKASSGAMALLSARFEDVVQGPGTARFLSFLQRQAPSAILTLGHAVGGLGTVVGNVFRGFEPLMLPAEKALNRFVDKWLAKTDDLANSPGWNRFLDFVRKTAPQVSEAFGAIGGAVGSLVVALEPLVGPALGFITTFFDAVKKLTQSSGFKGFVGDVSDALGTLGGIVSENAGGIGTFLDTFGDVVKHLLEAVRPLVPHLITFVTNIGKFLDKVVSSPGFSRLVDAIGDALDKMGSALASMPEGTIDKVMDFLVGIVNIAGELGSAAHGIGLLAAAFLTLGGGMAAARGVGGILSALRGAGGAGAGAGAAASRLGVLRMVVPIAVSYAALKATGTYDSLTDFLRGDWEQAGRDAPPYARALGNKIAEAFGADRSPIEGMISQSLLDAWNGLQTSGDFQTTNIWDLFNSENTAAAAERKIKGTAEDMVQAAQNSYLRSLERASPEVRKGIEDTLWGNWQRAHDAVGEGNHRAAGVTMDEYLRALNEKGHAAQEWASDLGKGVSTGLTQGADGQGAGAKTGLDFAQGIGSALDAATTAGLKNSHAANEGLDHFDGMTPGERGAKEFSDAINASAQAALLAGGVISQRATTGSIWDGNPTGAAGAGAFVGGVSSMVGNAGAAGAALGSNAGRSSTWNGFTPGQAGASSWVNGVFSQTGAATGAGNAISNAAAGGASSGIFSAGQSGIALGAQFASGVASQANAASIAGAALAAAVGGALPRSPAKDPRSVFHGYMNQPSKLGERLALQYAEGIRAQIGAVRSASLDLAEAITLPKAGINAKMGNIKASARIATTTTVAIAGQTAMQEKLNAQMAELTVSVKALPSATGAAVGSTVGDKFVHATSQQTRELVTASRKG